MEYYSAIKNEILSFKAKLLELEDIMLIEISQTQKDSTSCVEVLKSWLSTIKMDNANKKKNPCMLIEKKINHKMLYTM
jgi:hypothetical protein